MEERGVADIALPPPCLSPQQDLHTQRWIPLSKAGSHFTVNASGSWWVGGRQSIVAMKSISRSRQVPGWKPAYCLQEACPWHLSRCLPYQQRQACMQVPMGSRPAWSPDLQSKFQGSKDYIEKPGLKIYKKVTVTIIIVMMSLFQVLLMPPNVRAYGA